MALKLKKAAGTATISQAMVDGKTKTTIAEETVEEKVEQPEPEEPVAHDLGGAMLLEAQALEPFCEVGVEASFTKNLGNFQSARLQVSLKMPAKASELDETFVFSRDWVNSKLESMITDLG